MTNLLEKVKKPLLLAILGPFSPFLVKNEFSQKIGLGQFLHSTSIYHDAKNRKISHMWRWDTSQNFFLASINELEKQKFIKKLYKSVNKKQKF